jgi:murein DD-endopeptidase MepM/ murein hydrolase activator NlpD
VRPAALDPPAADPAATDARRAADAELAARPLAPPVAAMTVADLYDTFAEGRGSGARAHEATDVVAPLGTPVRAVDDGRIAKLFDSRQGGLTVYQFDRTGRLAYYYAHLAAYDPTLAEGEYVARGATLGWVGTTGNAPAHTPHLHFAVFLLGPEANWWQGTALDPYPALRAAIARGDG